MNASETDQGTLPAADQATATVDEVYAPQAQPEAAPDPAPEAQHPYADDEVWNDLATIPDDALAAELAAMRPGRDLRKNAFCRPWPIPSG